MVASKEQISCALHDESCILSLKNSVYYGLNSVGARIWDLLREPCSISDILNVLLQEYDVDPELGRRDLLELLENLRKEELVEVRENGAG